MEMTRMGGYCDFNICRSELILKFLEEQKMFQFWVLFFLFIYLLEEMKQPLLHQKDDFQMKRAACKFDKQVPFSFCGAGCASWRCVL